MSEDAVDVGTCGRLQSACSSPVAETCLRPLLLPLLATLASPAIAAEATDMPLELQGSADLTYGGFAEFGALEEDGVNIGQRRILRNDLYWNIEFAPIDGIALTLGIDQTAGLAFNYPNARGMLFEPVEGGGTYLLSEEEVPAKVTAGGINGVWIGAAFAPFSERYDRGHKTTWRLDIGFRTASPNRNLWVAKNGKRGSAPGGTALKAAGAVSQDMGTGNPWASFELIRENKFTADLVDESGETWARAVSLQPASSMTIKGGVEVVAYDDPAQSTRFAVDFFLGFGYRTWEDISSGVYLPNVLDAGKGIPMTAGDQTFMLAGIHADYHINEYVRARTGPDFRFHTPFVPEHAYAVTTRGAHIGVGWMFRIEGMAQAQTQSAVSAVEDAIEEGVELIE